ncbi:phosphosulfolactate synthase [Foetidibacter luteolus]|uniref:phosphosulfolactate synthase n=1 Tax=Foetidibacter luteolus TaxID=2608880 RepID=UPI00129B2EDF|nr:phosphosulfolactate synthase [Foetidibacter luteolus]
MNFNLSNIPERTIQPRSYGLTMITDKGLSLQQTKDLLSIASPYIDLAKLAFGTSFVTPQLKEKIEAYQQAGVPVYIGGLLFEAFVARKQFDDYVKVMDDYGITYVEISDGSIDIPHAAKCGYIAKLSERFTVLSEVGSKDKDRVQVTPPYKWIELMSAELTAGASYIVAEAREAGTVGLYRDSGEVREGLVYEILTKIPAEKIIWEAPQKDQQLFFLKLVGCNANLGNIAPEEMIALEAMRIGLRGDSFSFFLNGER